MTRLKVTVGDRVFCRFKIKILEYFEDTGLFAIAVATDSGPEYVYIPIELGTLGLRFSINDYCSPGDHNPLGHPDYYKRRYIAPASRKAVYDYAGEKVYIVPDKDYHYNGKYFLEYLDTGEQIEKQAQLRTEEERHLLITEFINTELSGDVLFGIVVRILVRVTDLPGEDGNNIDVEYFSNTIDNDADLYHEDDIKVVIHDEGTHVEYELPLSFLKT